MILKGSLGVTDCKLVNIIILPCFGLVNAQRFVLLLKKQNQFSCKG